jgi:signal peptidase I
MHRALRATVAAVSGAPRARVTSVLQICVAGLLIAVCLGAACWRISGGRWLVVRTASMGQAAPVGTLLLTRPTSVAATHVGDIISFHAPGSGEVYTHRVIAKTAAGLQTRGDINASPDSWVLTGHNLIGKVTHRCWGLGWVLRALPLVLLCLAVLWLVTALIPAGWRSPSRQAGVAFTFAIASVVFHPWVGVAQLGSTATGGGVQVRVVSTGVFPVHLSSGSSSSGRLVDGQVGTVLIPQSRGAGRYHLTPSLDLSFGWWVVIIALCLAPLAWSLLVGLAPALPLAPDPDTNPDSGPDRPAGDGEDVGVRIVGPAPQTRVDDGDQW